MGRNHRIILIKEYPRTCAECPLCGIRPKEELEVGDKWTHICVASVGGKARLLSGRGTKQPDARNRCGKRAYEQWYFSQPRTASGSHYYEITPTRLAKYQLEQTKLCWQQV